MTIDELEKRTEDDWKEKKKRTSKIFSRLDINRKIKKPQVN
jgi:hypothetical protein